MPPAKIKGKGKESTDAAAISNRLGDLLVSEGLLTYEQLNELLEEQKQSGEKLNSLVVKKGFVDELKLTEFISKMCGFKFVSLPGAIKKEILASIPLKLIKEKKILPISFKGDEITVCISDPLNILVVDEIKITTGYKVTVVIATETQISDFIDKTWGEKSAAATVDKLKDGGGDAVIEESTQADTDDDEEDLTSDQDDVVPLIQIVNLILARAVAAKASDIHIEAFPKSLRVRYRIDGVLHEQPAPPKRFLAGMVSRIKIMADLDIAERRRPQDGRIKIKVNGKEIDIRLSICPCTSGEKVVMRIMDSSAMTLDITKLNLDPENFAIYTKRIHDPFGIILVTGPTGSGKSTTLYSTLHTLNTPDVNIMTAEDPVEFVLPGLNQVHCLADIGLNFPAALRSFLRQDPDIIMIGEIRDQETITIAISAALTGHLVFSTLHTNDAPGAITRILMMGVDPVLVSSALTMVVAQRLIRRICMDCKESYEVDTAWLASLGVQQKRLPTTPKATLYRGKGCDKCSGSGYRGRLGVHEVLEVNDEIRDLICKRATAITINAACMRNGMVNLQESVLRKLLDGITTAEEVIRITGSK